MNNWGLHAEYLAEAWYLHTNSIKPIFYGRSKVSLFKEGFMLRCFQHLSLKAQLLSVPCQTTDTPEASRLRSSRTRSPFPSDTKHLQQISYQLSHNVVNPAHDPSIKGLVISKSIVWKVSIVFFCVQKTFQPQRQNLCNFY